jgi:ABC-type Fe3+-hydroxamate transport system substrate-binding protein
MTLTDDLGSELAVVAPRRVVSLVPSLTEAVATTARDVLIGATDYCSHPADLDVPRVGGTKWPSVDRILALRPDLVLANAEENRVEDVVALRQAGIAVWVTFPRALPEALGSLGRMFAALGVARPGWLDDAERSWAPSPRRSYALRAVIPVWRRPWVVLGLGTFAGDVLSRVGVVNAFAQAAERYPRPTLDEIRAVEPDLVVLPDEPYAFSSTDGPESFPGIRCSVVSGRHLTWYGPSLVEARALLEGQLAG